MIAFFLPIVPPKVTSQGAGKRMVIPKDKDGRVTGRPMFFKNNKAQEAENTYLILCRPFRPDAPLEGPLKLQIDFVFPWRKTEPKKNLALGRLPHTSRPDCSNIVKCIEDCLTTLRFWNDDGQIADLHVTKAWGDKVGISVAVSKIPLPQHPTKREHAAPSGQAELF